MIEQTKNSTDTSIPPTDIPPTYAIIVASGTGSRSGLGMPKQFFKVAGSTILEHCLDVFAYHRYIKGVVVVCGQAYLQKASWSLEGSHYPKPIKMIAGGSSRQESVFLGLKTLAELEPPSDAKVLIHDGVRPFLSPSIIDNCVKALAHHNAITTAIASGDTILEVDNATNTITVIKDRRIYRRCQTPQGFSLDLIKEVHLKALSLGDESVSDDCGLVLKYSDEKIYVVEGSDVNIKITTPTDVALAERLWQISRGDE